MTKGHRWLCTGFDSGQAAGIQGEKNSFDRAAIHVSIGEQ